ncbi:MAG: hypothetical protein ACKVQJ_10105 [Pyrinomonadaceae bacterium]
MNQKTRPGNGQPVIGATCLSFLLFVTSIASGCGANEGILKSGKDERPPATKEDSKTAFARELDAMRTVNYNFVYVLRRRDGGKISAEDRGVIKLQTGDANRRIAADDDTAFIIGSNALIAPKNLTALSERFAVENYSPEPAAPANINTNSNSSK